MSTTPQTSVLPQSPRRWVGLALLAGVLAWSYLPTMTTLVLRWWQDNDYVYGFLVVPFAAYLLWVRRGLLEKKIGEKKTGEEGTGEKGAGTFFDGDASSSRGDPTGRKMSQSPLGASWGWGLLALSVPMRAFSAYTTDPVLEPLSLVPCLAGLVLIFRGWKGLHWAWPSLVFLVFMIPLPSFVASRLSMELPRIVTAASTVVLQTTGVPAAAEGNVIYLPNGELGVVDACGGLRSVMLFLTVCVGAMFLMKDLPEKILVVVSAVPVTIAANVIRIAVTGILHELTSPELAEKVFHDMAGLFMLPLAVGMLWLEIVILENCS